MELAKIVGLVAAVMVLVLAAGYAASEDPGSAPAPAQASR
jgi:hypothetical protein